MHAYLNHEVRVQHVCKVLNLQGSATFFEAI